LLSRYRIRDRNYKNSPTPPEKLYFAHFVQTGGNLLRTILEASLEDYQSVRVAHDLSSMEDDAALLNTEGKVFFSGHHLYGLPEYVGINAQYFTMLRHPCERVVSDYFWVNRRFSRFDNMRDFPVFVDQHDHLEFYIHRLARMEEHICCDGHFSTQDASTELNENDNRLAYHNLENKFLFVGITEEFDKSIFLLSRNLGLPTVVPWVDSPRHITNRFRPSFFSLPVSLRKLIEEKVEREIELYEYFRGKLEKCFEESDFGASFQLYMDYAHAKGPSGEPGFIRK